MLLHTSTDHIGLIDTADTQLVVKYPSISSLLVGIRHIACNISRTKPSSPVGLITLQSTSLATGHIRVATTMRSTAIREQLAILSHPQMTQPQSSRNFSTFNLEVKKFIEAWHSVIFSTGRLGASVFLILSHLLSVAFIKKALERKSKFLLL